MRYDDPPLPYPNLVRAFNAAISSVLAGAVLPPISAMFDPPLTLALLDVAYAAREERPTQYLVARACAAFATYAADQDVRQAPQGARLRHIEANI
ncbi:hypothetical protein [Mycobacterium paraterrae]|uniref:Uncharacterized protein n=1 Tax=Mycobacterium paraterrae TaxID=577492 RepID=A0ABY3VMJ0_9MYCO|nr:hypothetical protein [Mycobacterium paraterrae]UMB70651.1 hypothetical protein MKK62_04880 [Mycobacterium paraterrae]